MLEGSNVKPTEVIWNRVAKAYRSFEEKHGYYRYLMNILLKDVIKYVKRIKRSRIVIEIGCGAGFSTTEISKFLPSSLIIGVDISNGMLRVAWERLAYAKNILFVDALAEKLPSRSGFADIILSNAVFWMIDNVDDACIEILNTLRTDGIFAFNFPVEQSPLPEEFQNFVYILEDVANRENVKLNKFWERENPRYRLNYWKSKLSQYNLIIKESNERKISVSNNLVKEFLLLPYVNLRYFPEEPFTKRVQLMRKAIKIYLKKFEKLSHPSMMFVIAAKEEGF